MANDQLAQDAVPHTSVVLWLSGLFKPVVTTTWTACAAVRVDWSHAEFAVVGEGGQLLLVTADGSYREESVFPSEPGAPGMLKGAACVESRLVAVGAGYWAYSLDSAGIRRDFSVHTTARAGAPGGVGFESVAGLALDDLYAVGWDGEIWHFDGGRWSAKPSPTNLILSHAICLPSGEVVACGQNGTVIRGRGDRWRALETGVSDNLWSVAWFQDALFAASSAELFRFTDRDEPDRVGLEANPMSFYWLDGKNGVVLLSTGAKDIVLVLPDREIKIE